MNSEPTRFVHPATGRAEARTARRFIAWPFLAAVISTHAVAVAATPSGVAAPVVAGSAAVEPYAVDSRYAGGNFTEDAFASFVEEPNKDFVGRKVLRVNGDVLVAGLVKYPSGNQTNGQWNLGLVRYDAIGGTRLTWSDPAPTHAHYQDQYVLVPNSANGLIRDIADMRVLGDRIYVLVDEQYTASINLSVARVYVFDLSGRLVSGSIPFSANSIGVADTQILAGGLATYTDLVANRRYLVVTATRFRPDVGHGRPVFRRYEIVDVGGLGASTGTIELNTSACWNTAWECQVRAVEANALFSPKLYVLFAYRGNASSDWDVVVSRIDTNGQGDPSWDPNNVHWNISDGGDRTDWAVGLEVRTPPSAGVFRDEVYALSRSARNCQPGVGVLRFDHDGGVVGSRLFGGSTQTGTDCTSNSRRFDHPRAIVANATNTHTNLARLAVVGETGISFVVGPPTNATLAILDAQLNLLDWRDYRSPLSSTTNFGTRMPALWGVVADGNGTFTATGSLAYPSYTNVPENLRGKRMVTTVRFAPDSIMTHGFE